METITETIQRLINDKASLSYKEAYTAGSYGELNNKECIIKDYKGNIISLEVPEKKRGVQDPSCLSRLIDRLHSL